MLFFFTVVEASVRPLASPCKEIREVSKEECVIMGDFNHGHIQWESLECWR